MVVPEAGARSGNERKTGTGARPERAFEKGVAARTLLLGRR
jgi:hypothetical protein